MDVDELLDESFANLQKNNNSLLNSQTNSLENENFQKLTQKKQENSSSRERSPSVYQKRSKSKAESRKKNKRSKTPKHKESKKNKDSNRERHREHSRSRRRDYSNDRTQSRRSRSRRDQWYYREREISKREKERELERKKRQEERNKELDHDNKIKEYLENLNPDEAAALEKERPMLSVLVTLLPPKLRNRELMDFFEENGCGLVRDARIISDRTTRKSKGYAYVEFLKRESVSAAIALTGQKLNGKRIVVQYSQAEKNALHNQIAVIGPCKVYVANFHPELEESHVAIIMSKFGEVEQAALVRDRDSNQSTGAAFVTFKNSEAAKAAVDNCNGIMFQNRQLKVIYCQTTIDPLINHKVTWPVKALEFESNEFDEANSGLPLNSMQVTQLMSKYSAGRDLISSVPNAAPKTSSGLTNCVRLSNMFDLNGDLEEDWHLDLADDVKDEATKYGQLLHIHVDKAAPEGHVYLKFFTTEAALLATKAMDGRFFDGKIIKCEYLQPQFYSMKFPGH